MIPKILISSNKNKGSFLSLPAHGWVGARATSSLAAHFALRNTASNSAEKKGQSERGRDGRRGLGGGIPPRPSRSPAVSG